MKTLKTYKQGQVDLFNRLDSILLKPYEKGLDEDTNALKIAVALIKELNKIREELSSSI